MGSFAYSSDAPGLAGVYHYGGGGRGVLGSAIPDSGQHGASILFNDKDTGDAAKEFRALIGAPTPPVGASLFVSENGALEISGATDGSYLIPYTLYVDGVNLGAATATVTVGAPSAVPVSSDLALSWSVGAAASQVSADLGLSWSVAAASAAAGVTQVAADLALSWSVAQQSSSNLLLSWATMQRVSADVALSWAVYSAAVEQAANMITSTQASAYLATLGVDVDADMLDDALATVATAVPAMQTAGYSAPTIRRIQRMAVALVAAPGGPRRVQSQGAPSGASRSFKYGDADFSALRRSLRALDTAGTVAQIVGPDPAGAALLWVV